MLMTEEEAKGKVCGLSMGSSAEHYEKCHASGCAMWRWRAAKLADDPVSANYPRRGEYIPSGNAAGKIVGFCGLAGQPVVS